MTKRQLRHRLTAYDVNITQRRIYNWCAALQRYFWPLPRPTGQKWLFVHITWRV